MNYFRDKLFHLIKIKVRTKIKTHIFAYLTAFYGTFLKHIKIILLKTNKQNEEDKENV